MRLIEALKQDEVTVWDKDYDIEVYFDYDPEADDSWSKSMNKIAEILEVVESSEDGVTVNLSEVIERNINNGEFEKLFINNDVDDIMDDIENIFAGYVSEEWLEKFANSLK